MKSISRIILLQSDLYSFHSCTRNKLVKNPMLCRHICRKSAHGAVGLRSVSNGNYATWNRPLSSSSSASGHDDNSDSTKDIPAHPTELVSATTGQSSAIVDQLTSVEDNEHEPLVPDGSVSPSDTSILLFPGQGSQFVGMAKQLLPFPNVKAMFNQASEVLGYDLLDLCLNGPKRKLDATEFCQPAIFVTSLAAVERLREEAPQAVENCSAAAGFSVGEYAALVFSDALSFEDGLQIIKVRAQGMQRASELESSGMMTCFINHSSRLSYACHIARLYCQKKLEIPEPVCAVANYLYPECKVVAGNTEALDFINENKKEFGILRTKRLPVSGAFHTKLMKPAVESLGKAIDETQLQQPLISVYSNVTGHKHSNKLGKLKGQMVEQVYKPVKWEQVMHNLLSRRQGEAFPGTYELGPGRQLGTLLRMVNKKAHQFYKSVEV